MAWHKAHITVANGSGGLHESVMNEAWDESVMNEAWDESVVNDYGRYGTNQSCITLYRVARRDEALLAGPPHQVTLTR
jgi:hypothetical protein